LTGERRDRHRGLPGQVAGNLRAPIPAFDADTRDVIEKFDFDAQIGRLDRAKEGERTTWPSAQCT
jgi:peptidoglycan/xylan/chitin deacetylase (PgdA/CDA1 family)